MTLPLDTLRKAVARAVEPYLHDMLTASARDQMPADILRAIVQAAGLDAEGMRMLASTVGNVARNGVGYYADPNPERRAKWEAAAKSSYDTHVDGAALLHALASSYPEPAQKTKPAGDPQTP